MRLLWDRLPILFAMQLTPIPRLPADLRKQVLAFSDRESPRFFGELQPRIGKDGNQWWAQQGADMQSCVAGFGVTIEEP